jgi:hypothetical protein
MRSPLVLVAAATLACAAIELILAVAANQGGDLGFEVALYAMLPRALTWVCVLVWSVVVATRLTRRKEWMTAAFSPAIPIIAFAATYCAIRYADYPLDYMHFRAERATYDAEVSQLPRDGRRYAEFNWGGLTFASRGVVYDETDEVALPYGHQSSDWKKRMRSTDLTCGRWSWRLGYAAGTALLCRQLWLLAVELA